MFILQLNLKHGLSELVKPADNSFKKQLVDHQQTPRRENTFLQSSDPCSGFQLNIELNLRPYSLFTSLSIVQTQSTSGVSLLNVVSEVMEAFSHDAAGISSFLKLILEFYSLYKLLKHQNCLCFFINLFYFYNLLFAYNSIKLFIIFSISSCKTF